jgi:hypothetical protein
MHGIGYVFAAISSGRFWLMSSLFSYKSVYFFTSVVSTVNHGFHRQLVHLSTYLLYSYHGFLYRTRHDWTGKKLLILVDTIRYCCITVLHKESSASTSDSASSFSSVAQQCLQCHAQVTKCCSTMAIP